MIHFEDDLFDDFGKLIKIKKKIVLTRAIVAPVGLDTLVNVTVTMQAAKSAILRLNIPRRVFQRLGALFISECILDLVDFIAR